MQPQTHSSPSLNGAAFVRDFWFKSIAGVGCIAVFSGVFQWLQQHPRVEPRMWDWCPLWGVIPFHAAWTWPYLAMFPLIAFTWMVLPGWREVCRFFVAMLATGLVAWTFFYVWPTGSVRAPMAEIPWYYHAVITADAPLNSFPCLHAAFSVVSGYALLHGPLRIGRAWQIGVWVLVSTICIAAIALRQHTDFDVLGGIALGGAAAWGYRRSLVRSLAAGEVGEGIATGIDDVAEISARD